MISSYQRIGEENDLNKFLMFEMSVHHLDNSNRSRGWDIAVLERLPFYENPGKQVCYVITLWFYVAFPLLSFSFLLRFQTPVKDTGLWSLGRTQIRWQTLRKSEPNLYCKYIHCKQMVFSSFSAGVWTLNLLHTVTSRKIVMSLRKIKGSDEVIHSHESGFYGYFFLLSHFIVATQSFLRTWAEHFSNGRKTKN